MSFVSNTKEGTFWKCTFKIEGRDYTISMTYGPPYLFQCLSNLGSNLPPIYAKVYLTLASMHSRPAVCVFLEKVHELFIRTRNGRELWQNSRRCHCYTRYASLWCQHPKTLSPSFPRFLLCLSVYRHSSTPDYGLNKCRPIWIGPPAWFDRSFCFLRHLCAECWDIIHCYF